MLSATSTNDLVTGVYEVTVSGRLDLEGAGILRTAVLKGLAEQPLALLLDLDGMDVADPLSLLILPTLERRAAEEYGLHLCTYIAHEHPQREAVCHAAGRYMSVYGGHAEAQKAGLADAAGCRRLHMRVAANEAASAIARDLAADVCERWGIPHVGDDARIVASELASNAVRHAGADFDLILLYRAPFLHVQALDSDPRVPLFPISTSDPDGPARLARIGGWGLYLIYPVASGCGVVIRPRGKLVWATLRTQPVSG